MLEEHYGFIPTAEYPIDERHALNADEISAMQNHVDFGSHTCFHPVLTTCTDEESSKEISDSKRDIENLVQRQCRHFSYPNGDYGDRELALVESAGYSSARTIDVGWNDRKTDPYRLRITGVSDNASINILAAQLSGVPMFVRHLFAGSITGKHRTVRPRTQSYRRSEKDS
jgi:peptidoglycan/xylan/chitin deacetylase (PgdA/CDA1 family)